MDKDLALRYYRGMRGARGPMALSDLCLHRRVECLTKTPACGGLYNKMGCCPGDCLVPSTGSSALLDLMACRMFF